MSVVKYRLDSRMLHGQTCAAWGAILHVDEYLLVNEKTAKDPMQITLLELAAMGNEVRVVSPSEAKEILKEEDFYGDRTMVIFKELEDVAEIVRLGFHPDEISIGSMIDVPGKNRKKYESNFFVGPEDIENFKYLDAQGVKSIVQIVPDYKPKTVKDLVKY